MTQGKWGQSGTHHALLTPLEIRSQRLRIRREALDPWLMLGQRRASR